MSEFQYLILESVIPSKTNPRKRFPEAQLAELADNIRQHGVLQPILVRPIDAHGVATIDGQSVNGHPAIAYEIIAGECRYRASKLAGQPIIPAIIREMHDLEALQLQVFENLHRNDLHPMEEAEGFQQLLRNKTNQILGMTADELGAKVGKSRAYIYASLKLLALCQEARNAFFDGKLTQSTALLIARIPGEKLQLQALEEITRPNHHGDIPSYRMATHMIQNRFTLHLGKAIFDITDVSLNTAVGSCEDCPKRSGNCRDLCPDIESTDVCTDPDCFASKRDAHVSRVKFNGGKVIQGKEAEKLFPYGESYGGSLLNSGYAKASSFTGIKGLYNTEYATILGEDLPDPITVILPNGDTTLIYQADELKARVQAKIDSGEIVIEPDKPRPPSQWELEKEEKQRMASIETKRRARLFDSIHAKTKQAPFDWLLTKVLRDAIDQLTDLSAEGMQVLAWAYESPVESSEFIKDYLQQDRSTPELTRLLFEIMIVEGAVPDWGWHSPEDNDEDDGLVRLATIATELGINPADFFDESAPDPSPAAQAQEEVAPEDGLTPFEKIKAKELAKRQRRQGKKESAAADDDNEAAEAAGEAVPA